MVVCEDKETATLALLRLRQDKTKSDEKTLAGKLHVVSKRYTQRIGRHNLNLRQHLARLARKTLSFSKSIEMHDRVIGYYLNIQHY